MGLADILSRINWVDLLILTLLIRITYVGFYSGLGNEIIPLIGIFTTLFVSLHYYIGVGDYILNHTFISSSFSYLISFIGLALLTKSIFFLIEVIIVRRVIKVQVASLYDKIGGLAAGVVKGVLLVSIVIIALGLTPFGYIKYSITEKSLMADKFLKIGRVVHQRTAVILKMR